MRIQLVKLTAKGNELYFNYEVIAGPHDELDPKKKMGKEKIKENEIFI